MPYRIPAEQPYLVVLLVPDGIETYETNSLLEAFSVVYTLQYIPEEQAEVYIQDSSSVVFHEIYRNGLWLEYSIPRAIR